MQKVLARTLNTLLIPKMLIGTLKSNTPPAGEGFILPLFNENILLHDYHLQ